MDNKYDLNFPFYVYPGTPCNGYDNITDYIKELERLYAKLIFLTRYLQESQKRTIVHVTIGAPLEEQYYDCPSKMKFQWQQLYPYHLCTALEKGYDVIHIIISPGSHFSDSHFLEPYFISMTNDTMKWVKNEEKNVKKEYFSKDGRYKVFIFNTPMPNNDKRNKSIIDKMHEKKMDQLVDINRYLQTKNDIDFIYSFYDCFAKLFDVVCMNGFVTCFSFAVFNMGTKNAHINNYRMFNEVISLFESKHNRILAEWTFFPECYTVRDYHTNLAISYVKPIEPMTEGYYIHICNESDEDSKTIRLMPYKNEKRTTSNIDVIALLDKKISVCTSREQIQRLVMKYAHDIDLFGYLRDKHKELKNECDDILAKMYYDIMIQLPNSENYLGMCKKYGMQFIDGYPELLMYSLLHGICIHVATTGQYYMAFENEKNKIYIHINKCPPDNVRLIIL